MLCLTIEVHRKLVRIPATVCIDYILRDVKVVINHDESGVSYHAHTS